MSPKLIVQLLLLGAIWGGSFAFMQVAIADFTPLALIEVRVSIGAAVLIGILAMRGELSSLKGRTKEFLILGAINSAIPFSLFAFAAKLQTAGLSSVLNSTAPLFGALIAFVWLKERLRWMQTVGLFLGFCGVIILATSKNKIDGQLIAIGAGLLAAFLYGLAAHYSKRYLKGCPPMAVSGGSLIGASVLLLPMMPWSMSDQIPSLRSWGCAITLGVVCTGIAYMLYFRMLDRYGATSSMTVAYLIPIFGVIWGYLFLGEPITVPMLIGGSVVLLGTILVTRSPTRK
jgi:drug/metabolite transporter (DMT)-like permease